MLALFPSYIQLYAFTRYCIKISAGLFVEVVSRTKRIVEIKIEMREALETKYGHKNINKKLRTVFEGFDSDRSGQISKSELVNGLKSIGVIIKSVEVLRLFRSKSDKKMLI